MRQRQLVSASVRPYLPRIVPEPRVDRILDVARDFPHCTAVAVDLVPMQDV